MGDDEGSASTATRLPGADDTATGATTRSRGLATTRVRPPMMMQGLTARVDCLQRRARLGRGGGAAMPGDAVGA